MLGDIEAAVQTTVASTQQGQDGLERSMREVVTSAESLRQLGQIIEETSEAATRIAGAVKDQTAGVSEIATAVGSLDEGMGATLAGMKDVDRAAADVHGTAERIGAVVDEFRI
jgi:methyl-accepting chemotaxis protein